ncbi:MAG TPA: SCO family protein [Croceibacterium sp.]
MTRNRRLGLAAGLLLAALTAGAAMNFLTRGPAPAEGLKAGTFDPARAAPDFALRGSDGSEVTLARYRGKVVLLTFGFTYCAAVCPTTLATLAQARGGLGDKADAVQVIFVTVDPERDDVAHMQQYLAAFDRSFIGATGEPDALAEVREAYGVTAEREGTGPDYAMAHTSSIFLIDRAGRLRAVMPFGHDAADFVHDIERL